MYYRTLVILHCWKFDNYIHVVRIESDDTWEWDKINILRYFINASCKTEGSRTWLWRIPVLKRKLRTTISPGNTQNL